MLLTLLQIILYGIAGVIGLFVLFLAIAGTTGIVLLKRREKQIEDERDGSYSGRG